MKKLILFVFIILAGKLFSQTPPPQSRKSNIIIEAKDAYKYIGKLVEVRDSVYSGRIVNDTTAIFQMGRKTTTPRLIMIYVSKTLSGVTTTVDPRIVEKLQRIKIYIHGTITGNAQAPQIIVDGLNGHLGARYW